VSLQKLTDALESLVRDEIAGKARLAQELGRQQEALVSGSPDDIDIATRAVEVELAREMERTRRRDAIFARLAAHWSVSASVLTLSSIAERLGDGGHGLASLRADLRAAIADVLRRNRRVARLVSVQHSVMNDTFATLLGVGANDQEPGALFEARG
jgi:hypothetical protein